MEVQNFQLFCQPESSASLRVILCIRCRGILEGFAQLGRPSLKPIPEAYQFLSFIAPSTGPAY